VVANAIYNYETIVNAAKKVLTYALHCEEVAKKEKHDDALQVQRVPRRASADESSCSFRNGRSFRSASTLVR
jgi:hypothetical protein